MRSRLTGLTLILLTLASLAILPALESDAEQCRVCDNVHGIAVCVAEDPPNIAYRGCFAGEICLQIGSQTVCFPEACQQWNLCILYLD